MSEENIERLRQAYEAFSRGDFEEALTFAHPEIEFFPPGDAAPFRGIEKFRAWMEPDAFDRQVIEPLEFIESGNKVLVEQLVKSRGAGSGIELEGRSWSVWTVNEDGLATRVEGFMERDEAEAREAAGLSESAMSQENAEVVRSIFAAWRRGDFRSVEWAHPEITFVVADGPTPGTWSGVAAMAEAWREALSAFEHLRTEADEYRALDDERVFVLMHLSGRGKTSGLEVGDIQMKGANLFQLRDGKVTRLVLYWDRQHAHPDVGLSE